MEDSKSARYVAEFVGTFMLVFTIGCNTIGNSGIWGVTSIACVLMVCIYALGGVSGANFNPAVSAALAVTGKLPIMEAGIYCGVQIVAGILAALSYSALFGWKPFNLHPKLGFEWWQAGLAEMLYTFMLCFVVLNVATAQGTKGNQFYGLAIGFVIVAGGYGAGALSGGCFNPAVALGIDVSSFGHGFGWSLVYTGFEFLGAALAGALFRLVRPEEFGGQAKTLSAKLLSEFLGTFMLVLTVGLNVLVGSGAGAWSIAAALMCMIYALGDVSGAHFNPAVTTAIALSGRDKQEPKEAGMYIGAQLLGGLAGALLYTAMHKGDTFPLGPGEGYHWASAATAEIVFTFVLCYVVLTVATVKGGGLTQFFGLAIGSCVTVGGFAVGAVSGASLNPAVSFGISSSRIIGGGHFWHCVAYTIFELVGAAIASGVFRLTHPAEYAKGPGGH